MRAVGAISALGMLLISSCAGERRTPSPQQRASQQAPSRQPAPSPALGDPLGTWTVVAHRMAGLSAMDNAQAGAWHGRAIRFERGVAVSGADTCRQATYPYRSVPTDSLLGVGFHVRASALVLPESLTRIGFTEVACGGASWAAPGGQLLWLSEKKAYTVWDGVFFELRR